MKTLLIIFGITGDLSTRKLLPALGAIMNGPEAPDMSIVGVSRREVDVLDLVKGSPNRQVLADKTRVFTMDVSLLNDYKKLKRTIDEYSADQTLIYLSVPPGAAAQIVDRLGEAGINTPNVRLLFEKPFGFDLASAKDFIQRTGRYFSEDALYRIDHYMAKEISARLLELRRDSDALHHHWSNRTVKEVRIVASESIGIEGRAQFYEQTGALRDFVQGHLMQLLSLVLMVRPTMDKSLPAQRLEALNQVSLARPEMAIRAQYEGYDSEAGNPGSTVETFVAVTLESNDPHWQGVPFQLITGKALDEKRSYVEVQYRDGKNVMFEEGATRLSTQPQRDAYERVLLEAIAGRKELFTTSEEIIRSWEILAPLQKAWAMNGRPLGKYSPGISIDSFLQQRY